MDVEREIGGRGRGHGREERGRGQNKTSRDEQMPGSQAGRNKRQQLKKQKYNSFPVRISQDLGSGQEENHGH
jgi:hypothetical protein